MDNQTDFHRVANALIANTRDLEDDLDWLTCILQARLAAYFAEPSTSPRLPTPEPLPPTPDDNPSPYAQFIARHHITAVERLLILLALTPHLRPQLLDVLWMRNNVTQRGFTEFGGAQGQSSGGFLPTGETATFLLGSEDLATRLATAQMLDPSQRLAQLEALSNEV